MHFSIRNKNGFRLVSALISAVICTCCVMHSIVTTRFNKDRHTVTVDKPLKKIMYWTSYFTHLDFNFGRGRKAFVAADCVETRCHATPRRLSTTPVEEYDVVLFHGWNLDDGDLPPVRRPHQRYVLYLMEAPGIFPDNLKKLPPGFFNWTITYRLDSDILGTYGYFKTLKEPQKDLIAPVKNWQEFPNDFQETDLPERTRTKIGNKTKLVAWFVSHCTTPGKREDYVTELSYYIPVDIYGQCGTHKCDSRDSDKCFRLLEDDYKFYLSFENSICQDYVTEKLYNVMKYNVVPIVYGGANYSVMAPPGSYIHTDRFAQPWQLAQYLLDLDAYPEDYAKYFWWRSYYEPQATNVHHFCKLCALLHEEGVPVKSYTNIQEWYAKNETCRHVEEMRFASVPMYSRQPDQQTGYIHHVFNTQL